jgi:DNA polymerase I-like protein with 3'-5' exonuclease and polymerase domains
VLAFKLSCPPTKQGLKDIGKGYLRNIAKTVIFGLMYGRGAKAIALAAKEQGTELSVDEAQALIDAIFKIYPELPKFFEAARNAAIRRRWLCNCFGRFRRFPTASDYKMEGEFERQAMNFPIQSGIASAVDRGLAWLDHFIEEEGLEEEIKLVLQIHDAGLMEVRLDYVPYAIELAKYAMTDMVPIYPTRLDGVPTGGGPFRLGLEFSVEKAWGGEKFTAQECEKFGIPAEFAAKT